MKVPDGVKDFFGALAGSFFALFDACPCTEFAFGVTNVSGGDQEVTGANDHGQITWFLFGEFHAECFGFFLRAHREGFHARIGGWVIGQTPKDYSTNSECFCG